MSVDVLRDTDPAVVDPAILDPDFPPETFVTHFVSSGTAVHASMWLAQGPAPKATVIVPSQAYGGDRLESLFIPLMNAGLNVFTFHPRGMWDGSVPYSEITGLEDIHAAVDFLRLSGQNGKRTATGHDYRVDPARIGVLGLSGAGGTAGFAACAESEAIDYAVAIAPGSYEIFRDRTLFEEKKPHYEFMKAETAGRVDLPKRIGAFRPEDLDRIHLAALAPRLKHKKLLLVGAAYDTVTPIDYTVRPVVKALRDAGATRFTDVIMETDHMFLTKRIALARLVISWLRSEGIA
jgi:uncharacterized protein